MGFSLLPGAGRLPNAPAKGLVFIAGATASSATSVSINNCFSGAYNNYRAILTGSASGLVNLDMRFRTGGTDNTSATQSSQYLEAASSTVTGFRGSSLSYMNIGGIAATASVAVVDIYSPALAESTMFTAINGHTVATPSLNTLAGGFSGSTQFDGLTFYIASGTFTVSLTVYGYANP
jgi:hypothetical protein